MKNNEEVLSIVYKKRDSLKFEINNKGLVVVLNKQDYKIQNFLRKCKFNIPEYKKIEFDEYCSTVFLLIDGKKTHTKWLNYRTLEIPLEDFEKGEEICVTQIGDDGIELSYTNTLYINDATTETTTEMTSEEIPATTTEE